jgi:2-dehydropantoate 2-reductase
LNSVNPTRISDNILGELYAKLIINACINTLGVIGGVRLGALLTNKTARQICIKLMREALAVAEAMGIRVAPAGGGKLDYYTFLAGRGAFSEIKRHLVIRMIGHKYRRIKSSSLQSLERGRRTEVDFLNGYICESGRAHQVPTPVNDAVRQMVKEIENKQRKMGMANFKSLPRTI